MTGTAVFLAVVLLGAIILFAVISSNPRRQRHRYPTGSRQPVMPLTREQMHVRWATIQTMADSGGNNLRHAISEGDKLLDHALKQQGLRGDSMGERLKAARGRFPTPGVYDGVWRAHKLRNVLVHEVGFDLVPSQAREALNDFERGLKDLGAL